MGCCSSRERFGGALNEQRWDYVNLSDFKSTSCWSPFSYGIVYIFLIISIAVYAVDLYTAANLLFFDRWSSQVKPAIPFVISKWVFAGCIILSWILLVYRWVRALRAMRTGVITASYLDPLAVRIESIRPGNGRGWRRFLVFAALTKGRKGSEYVALFAYFSFEAWLRIVFAEGPRQVINALTLYSVLRAKLIPVGAHAPNDGHTPVIQFFVNVKILANANTQQATILFGMLYVLVIWVLSAISLAIAFLLYILFLWHHIPSADGSLSKFCRRKIEKRLHQIVKVRVEKAIAKEQQAQLKRVATGGTGASVGVPSTPLLDMKREPTLPVLGPDGIVAPIPSTLTKSPSSLSRANDADPFQRPSSPFGTRPASPFADRPSSPRPGNYNSSTLSREPTLPDLGDPFPSSATRPIGPSRVPTQSSVTSNASTASNAPLVGAAANMGYGGRGTPHSDRSASRNGRFDRSASSQGRPPGSSSSDRNHSAGPMPYLRGTPAPRSGSAMSNSRMPFSGPPTAFGPGPGPAQFQRRPTDPASMTGQPPRRLQRPPAAPIPGNQGQEFEMQQSSSSNKLFYSGPSQPPPMAPYTDRAKPRNFHQPFRPSGSDYSTAF